MYKKWIFSLAAIVLLFQTVMWSEASAFSWGHANLQNFTSPSISHSLMHYKPEMIPMLKSKLERRQEYERAENKQKQVTYDVVKGDTLSSIARKFQTSVDVLVAANQLANPNILRIGQKLDIPVAQSEVAAWLQNKENTQVMKATLTAYTAGFESTGKTPSHPLYGITASGTTVQEGRTIAVDPKIIPMGSTVYIEGVGVRVAEDTGSAIKGARIDVFIEDLDEALTFGVKRDVTVHILSLPKS